MSQWFSKPNLSWQSIGRILFAVGIAVSICQVPLHYLDSWTYDMSVRLTPSTPQSGHIQLVEITPSDVEFMEGEPDAREHTQLLERLLEAKPRFVVYLIDANNIEGSYSDLKAMSETAKRFENFIFTSQNFVIRGQEQDYRVRAPLDRFPVVMAMTTQDSDKFAKDGVSRRVILTNFDEPFIHHELASSYNKKTDPKSYRGMFNYYTSTQTLIDFRPPGTYKPISFTAGMTGSFDPELVRDKIILIGRNTVVDTNDYKRTPYSRELLAMTNHELHANMIDTLILDSAPFAAPQWINYIITILISLLTVYAVFTLKPSRGLIILSMALVSLLVVAYFTFLGFGMIMNITHPLLAIFICYYFFIPYRLIMENRKNWEYLQHNKMLTEVEELKTNFLRMMSHDLKTPLARIQGMTDIALRDGDQLTEMQQQAIRNISKSSRELTTFVESVLNLSRIETNEVKLELISKDVNAILKSVIDKLRYLAKEKNIEIIEDFEPVFSIRVDESLITQVFTNLVENAIKYSPEGTRIMVSTEELDGKVNIQVSDQGMGIPSEDQANIFDKFYRSSRVRNSSENGHGLGLYLTKYFIELHNGDISLDSQPQQGSTFSVNIPMDL
tara:strand:+ start:60488 stop:62326 length:1839 start_codon:yes stop_codon:yes gene_type:complete